MTKEESRRRRKKKKMKIKSIESKMCFQKMRWKGEIVQIAPHPFHVLSKGYLYRVGGCLMIGHHTGGRHFEPNRDIIDYNFTSRSKSSVSRALANSRQGILFYIRFFFLSSQGKRNYFEFLKHAFVTRDDMTCKESVDEVVENTKEGLMIAWTGKDRQATRAYK